MTSINNYKTEREKELCYQLKMALSLIEMQKSLLEYESAENQKLRKQLLETGKSFVVSNKEITTWRKNNVD